MDVIKAFNQELSSLYNTKPPISKQKITTITRTAIRAIKFYKHVVQSVEKFILKCKPEYKVPALYVIDSLVRQSRHQFQEKDVFGPRFAKNLKTTFSHLYQVPPEDKSKIIRVLNLWQKSEVFTPEVIHPLFDMADPNHPIHRELAEQQARNGVESSSKERSSKSSSSKHGIEQASSSAKASSQTDLLQQLQHLQSLLQNHGPDKEKVKFDKKLLDFDYGEEDNEDQEKNNQTAAEALGNILSNPEVLKQLQTLQSQTQNQFSKIDFDSLQREKKEQEMALQEKEFDKHLAATLPKLPFASVCDFNPDDVTSSHSSFQLYNQSTVTSAFPNMDMTVPPPGYPRKEQADFDERIPPFSAQVAVPVAVPQPIPTPQVQQQEPVVIDLDKIDSDDESSDKPYARTIRRSHRSRSVSRSRLHRHRSRSGSRNRSSRRRRSFDRDRDDKPERFFDKEKEAERRKKAMPPFKKNYLAVCSTTLWIGHLSKLVQEEELSDTFGEFGDVVSINLIPPRGCAFVCMNRRQDAAKALYRLKNTKLQGKTITLAWAPGKGMKDKEWKDLWEVSDGVTYIPYDRLSKDIDYDYLEDGGVFDDDTVPLWLKDHLKSIRKKQEDDMETDYETPTVSSTKGDLPGPTSETPAFIPAAPETVPTQVPPPVVPTSSPSVVTPVPAVTPQTSAPTASHPLMLPLGFPRLLGPMGLPGMTPTGLLPNVPLGVPPPALYKVHQQLLNRMPPPGNLFNQNLADFPEGMLSLPFGLQHLQSTLQQQTNAAAAASPAPVPVKDATPEKRTTASPTPLLNSAMFQPLALAGAAGFPANFPLMSVPPPSAGNPVLSVPPPAIVRKEEDTSDDDVVMEDTQKKPDEPTREKKDERRGFNKDRNDRHERSDSRGNDRYRDRDRDRDRDRQRDRDRDREDRDRYGRNNRGGRNHSPKRNNRDRNSRSSRWNDESEDKANNEAKPWNKSNNQNNRDTSSFNDSKSRDNNSQLNQPPPSFSGPPPTAGPGNNSLLSGPPGPNPGPGLLRTPGPPPFLCPPNAPHLFGPNGPPPPRNRFDGPSGPNHRFEGPPGPNNRFERPPGSNNRFEGPPRPGFEGPPGPNNRFERPPGPNNRFEGPPRPGFEGPPGPNNRFEGPPGPNDRFERPPGPNDRFEGPSGTNDRFEGPHRPGFEGPSGPNKRFEGPPGPNDRFDGPPGSNNRFDGPPGPNNRFDGPPGPNNRFDGPPGPGFDGPPGSNRFDGPPGTNNRFDGPPGPNNRFDGPPGPGFDGPPGSNRFDGPPGSGFDAPPGPNRFDGPPGPNNRFEGPGPNNRFEGPPGARNNPDNFDRFSGPPRRGDNFPPPGLPFLPPGSLPGPPGDNNFPPVFGQRGPPPRGPLPRALLALRPELPRPAIEPFRPRNPNFGMRLMGSPVPLGGIPRHFRFPGPDELDNRSPGRRNWTREEQSDSNRDEDAEPRSKRSRWTGNDEPVNGKDNTEKEATQPKPQLETSVSQEVSSVTNPTAVSETSGPDVPQETLVVQPPVAVVESRTAVESKPVVESELPVSSADSQPQISTVESVKELAAPEIVPLANVPAAKHEEPKVELPTQGPGEASEIFAKVEDPKGLATEEIVCDSTVD